MTTSKKSKIFVVLSLLIALIAIAALSLVVWKYYEEKGAPEPEVPDAEIAGPEVGTYYYDANIQEYTLTLNEGHTFALFIKGETFFGTYTLTGDVLVLDFSIEGKKSLEAELADNVITMTYDGAGYRLLKKVTYSINFVTNGGSVVPAQPVMNGKTAVRPTDPRRVGYAFVGWYEDAEFCVPFGFGTRIVTSDVTLYARWSAVSETGEFDVELDENHEGAPAPLRVTTVGGKLFDLPVPEREGYVFGGWWVSMSDDGEKLSYAYQEGMVLKSELVLYALWQEQPSGTRLNAPVVNVTVTNISWTPVIGAAGYVVRISGADGALILEEQTEASLFEMDFSALAAGEYEILVQAISGDEREGSLTYRYYTNKMLPRVTGLRVIDTMLLFDAVSGAGKYLIRVECGDAAHQHDAFDNGTSTSFDFSQCPMREGGIRFTVTALAEGYAPSVSRTFVYEKSLKQVSGYTYDSKNQVVSWEPVENAEGYMVLLLCGNEAHGHDFFYNGSATFVSLKECDATENGILVKVYPKTKGYFSAAASEYRVVKETLATPADIRIQGNVLSWGAVNGAVGYAVCVNGEEYEASDTLFDLSDLMNGAQGSVYTLSVRAIGEHASLWSDTLTAVYRDVGGGIKYAAGLLSWQPVLGVEGYEIQVNEGEILTVRDGTYALPVVLTKAGENVLRVRFVDGTHRSEWMQTKVIAHAISFDVRGGSAQPTQYKAVGDPLALPVSQKEGYVFRAWYRQPQGAACNGLIYTDEIFSETGSVILYAYFVPASYTVSYVCGEDGSMDVLFDTVRFGEDFCLRVPAPADVRAVFGGWFSAPFGEGVQYTDAQGQSLAPFTLAQDVQMYAYWIHDVFRFTALQDGTGWAVFVGANGAHFRTLRVPFTYADLPVLMLADGAFEGCDALEELYLPTTLAQIQTAAFADCAALQAICIYEAGDGEGRYFSHDGVLYEMGEEGPGLCFLPLSKTGTYRIPDGVFKIPAYAFAGCKLSGVSIPACLAEIGTCAFSNAKSLSDVIFESGEGEVPLSIAERAFEGCVALERILLPARLAEIALDKYALFGEDVDLLHVGDAFAGCSALSAVEIAKGNAVYRAAQGVIYSADSKTLLYCLPVVNGTFLLPAEVQSIAPGAFIGCAELESVTLHASIAQIGECAFYGAQRLASITFAARASVDVSVERYAFRACGALEQLFFESGSRLAVIGEGAFYACASLKSFTVPTTVTLIAQKAFYACGTLQELSFAPNGKTLHVEADAFAECTALVSVALPPHVVADANLFGGCTSLVELSVDVRSAYLCAEDGVLYNKDMTKLLTYPAACAQQSFALPQTVREIAPGAFAKASYLKEVTFTDSEAELVIGERAFYASGLVSLTLPQRSLLRIGQSAFENCTALAFVSVCESVDADSIGERAFLGCEQLSEIYNASALELVAGDEAYGYLAAYALRITLPSEA